MEGGNSPKIAYNEKYADAVLRSSALLLNGRDIFNMTSVNVLFTCEISYLH